MNDRSTGPACGNNPNFQMSDGDRKAVADFKTRLALKEAAKPYIERAAWVDFDPLMEVIAATVWDHCARDDERMPHAVRDDPRTIAAFAAAVARAHATADRATILRQAADQFERDGRYVLQFNGLQAAVELRRMADCHQCSTGAPHTEHCPTPETHNAGCGCPSDVAAAIASCPGYEMDGPPPCRCPCEGCTHSCAAHQPAAALAAAQTEEA